MRIWMASSLTPKENPKAFCVRSTALGLERKLIIPLDNKLRIRGTENCWQLERLREIKGESAWKPYKYFTSIDSALHSAAQRELRIYPTQTLTETLDACRRVTHKYARIFDDVGRREKEAA